MKPRKRIKPLLGWAIVDKDGLSWNEIDPMESTLRARMIRGDRLVRVRLVPVRKRRKP